MGGTPQSVPVHEAPEITLEGDELGEAAEEPLDRVDSPDSQVEQLETVREESRFFQRLRQRLHKTRENFVSRMDRLILGKKTIDLQLLDELEEILITSDLGVRTAQLLIGNVTEKIKREELSSPERLREHLREEIRNILTAPLSDRMWRIPSQRPHVLMVVGVNGVGKTTTIGKLAKQFKEDGHKVLLVAADTFRAAAVEQLLIWGERAGVPVIHQQSGADPSAVAFDAMDAALSREVDIVIVDTAGRMHTKVNLMEELKKVHRVINRKLPSAPHEVLLVLDATTGQNALSQARMFKEGIGLTGLILTKLDGTAKGGIIVAISEELKIPVRYIGIGEGLDDLRPFDPDEFTHALF
ncbi:MAG: signal recognition particle-docking protein FtsY [Deltaproteobacteria bacterium]|nr:signal recognition particle-docking protein FtsY [Deltaproteobacteria bacterium]